MINLNVQYHLSAGGASFLHVLHNQELGGDNCPD